MKKSLIAVAVAGAFVAPVAMADVTLSGAINLGIEISKSRGGTAPGSQSLTRSQLNSNYSHVDLESVDDIGDGNKVIFHYQLNAAPQNASGINNNNRNSFLGVVGGWGAFKMGTNENVYERHMYQADPLDGAVGPGGNLMLLGTPGANTAFEAGQSACTTGCVDFYRRTDHTIWYESPNWGGFTFEVDQTLSAFKTANPGGTDPKVLSIGGKFAPEGLPFYVDAAFEKHHDMFGIRKLTGTAIGTGSDDTAFQVGAGITFGELGLHARVETLKYKLDDSPTVSEYKRNAIWLGAKFGLPTGYVGGEIGVARKGTCSGTAGACAGAGLADNTKATMIGVGYFHNLSKQSQLQFIYGRTTNKDNASYTQAAAPLSGAGADHDVFHVGIKHTF